jgi:hypothetical protein
MDPRLRTYNPGVAGYVILIAFAIVAVAVVIHVRRTPPIPPRRPFDSDENSLIGEPKSTFSARDPGAGRGGDGMI